MTDQTVTTIWSCPRCHAVDQSGAYCQRCGVTRSSIFEPPSSPLSTAPLTPPPTRSPRFVAVVAVITVLALVASLSYVLVQTHVDVPSVDRSAGLASGSATAPVTNDPTVTMLPRPALVLPPELSATPSTPGVLVDRTTVETVTPMLEHLRLDALRRQDQDTLGRLDADDALLADRAGCGCTLPDPGSLQFVSYAAFAQTQYPVSFAAEVRWSDRSERPIQSTVDLLVITRADAASTWKVSLETAFAYDTAEPFLGPATTLPAAGPPDPAAASKVSTLPSALADYFQSWTDRGRPPDETPFYAGGSLVGMGKNIVEFRSQIAATEDRQTTYSAGPKAYLIPTADGATSIVCGSVRWESHSTPVGSGPLVQPDDRSRFGAALAPGEYSTVARFGVFQSCFVNPTGEVGVQGDTGGIYEASGTR